MSQVSLHPAASAPHDHGHAHTHDHDAGHRHGPGHPAVRQPMEPLVEPLGFSLLRASIGLRLAVALALSSLIWLAVYAVLAVPA